MTLELRDIGRRVGSQTYLSGISLTLQPGTFNVLLGRTTAGKTSLMRVMAGLDRPDKGQVLADGVDVTGLPPQRRSVAMVYQQFINYPSLSVFDNIAAPLRRQGLKRDEIDRRVGDAAAMVRIEPFLKRLPAELSGGQQQRCAIARALVKEASLLLLDEPLVNLDYKLREELRAELAALFRQRDQVIVYATTEPQEALIFGGQAIVMDEGRVLQVGPTADLFHRPASQKVADLFSDPPLNTAEARIEPGRIVMAGDIVLPRLAHLAALPEGAARIGIRASHLHLRGRRDAGFAAEVELAEISGSETFVHVRRDGIRWVVQCQGVEAVELGQELEIGIDWHRAFVFSQDGGLLASPPAELEA